MDESVATTNISTTVNLATRKRRFFAFLIDSLMIGLIGRLSGLVFGDFYAHSAILHCLSGPLSFFCISGFATARSQTEKRSGKNF